MAKSNQKWKEVLYSKREINDAGNIVRNTDVTEELKNAKVIIDNWRAAHAYPLHVIYTNLRRLVKGRKDIIVAERLKRLESITNKLKREAKMELWRMQDLGGCRVIVPSIEEVKYYAEEFKKSKHKHIYKRESDYISNPKKSGYRSLHLIYQFQSDTKETYNKNMLIEIQFRTKLQHIWATALETMDIFTKVGLKAGEGPDSTKRFFVLVSSLFALKEECVLVPDTPQNKKEIIDELRLLNDKYHILDRLSAIRAAVDHHYDLKIRKKGYYLLILDYSVRRLKIKYFKHDQIVEANKIYVKIENSKNAHNLDVVLVRVESFGMLKNAYPNYFADIGEFIDIVQGFLNEETDNV